VLSISALWVLFLVISGNYVPPADGYVTWPAPEGFDWIFRPTEGVFLTWPLFVATGILLWYFARQQLSPSRSLSLHLAGIIALGLLFRVIFLPHISGDYMWYVQTWVGHIRDSGMGGFITSGADYNVPYLYTLWLIARFPIPDLGLIKLASVLGDALLAVTGAAIVMHIVRQQANAANQPASNLPGIIAFAILWLLPTFILNSSYWAQSDSIYVAFCALALLFAMKHRPILCVLAASIAFSFKLQTVFFLPMLLVFLFTRKIKLRHLLIFPVFQVLVVVPALLARIPAGHLFGVYFRQMGVRAQVLTMDAPTALAILEHLTSNLYVPVIRLVFIGITFLFTFLALAIAFVQRNILVENDYALALTAMVFAILIPFFLPQMHDRYFYMAEFFAIVVAAVSISRWYLPALVTLASMVSYITYLQNFGMRGILFNRPMHIAAIGMGIALIIAIIFWLKQIFPEFGYVSDVITDHEDDRVSLSGERPISVTAGPAA